MHQFHKFILSRNSTCFGQFVCPSSGVYSLYTQQWYMSYRFVDSLRAGPGWNAEICYDARSHERKVLLHFLNCSNFSKYFNAKGGFAFYFEPLYIRTCTVCEIKFVRYVESNLYGMWNQTCTICEIKLLRYVKSNFYGMWNKICTVCGIKFVRYVKSNLYGMWNQTCTVCEIKLVRHVKSNLYRCWFRDLGGLDD
jgi:hypothetical protein